MIEVGKYNSESTYADFDSDLVVEGVVLEILSLNTLLKIFKNSSIVNLTTEALKPLLLLLNRYRSRRLYFRDCFCQLQSLFYHHPISEISKTSYGFTLAWTLLCWGLLALL